MQDKAGIENDGWDLLLFITKNLNLNKRRKNSTVRDALLSNLLL